MHERERHLEESEVKKEAYEESEEKREHRAAASTTYGGLTSGN